MAQPSEYAAAHTCEQTGLRLVPALGQSAYRIAKPSYGPFNPQKRSQGLADTDDWGRYDVPGHRTIYAAATAEGAYAESTASLRPNLRLLHAMASEYFDNLDPEEAGSPVGSLVQDEWAECGTMHMNGVARMWRTERRLYRLILPVSGWFVHIEHADSIAAITRAIGPDLARIAEARQYPLKQFTTADLRGECRQLSVAVAQWVRAQILEDGQLPHGIYYGSKLGDPWNCWAIWLRAIDDGKSASSEPTKADGQGQEIKDPEHNPNLKAVADRFNLRFY